jgi:hypothetical protein
MSSVLQWLGENVARLLGYEPPSFESNPDAEEAALDAARDWLALVDDERYAESWTQAAAHFQNAVPQDDWVQKSRGVRQPLGAVVDRSVRSARYATSLPGAPDGEYVVMQFDTQFENKEEAVETVTFVKEGASDAGRSADPLNGVDAGAEPLEGSVESSSGSASSSRPNEGQDDLSEAWRATGYYIK